MPKDGEHYYYVDSLGDVGESYYDTNDYGDLFRHKTGNCFKTEEEAQKERGRRLAEQELLALCDGESGDVAEIYFRSIDSRFAVTVISPCVSSPYHFATKESAQKAIDTLGKEKLKLIFRIED